MRVYDYIVFLKPKETKNMIREIIIRPALNGYICNVGCQTVVFVSREGLLHALNRYLGDPTSVEHEFIKNAVNPMEGPRNPETTRDAGIGSQEEFSPLRPPAPTPRGPR